ncbi:MAG: type II secretion system F family protein [Candidatus Micrarchaeota archaeon]
MSKVLILLIPYPLCQKLGARFRGLSNRILVVYPGLHYDMRNAAIDLSAEAYAAGSIFSSLIWGLLVGGLLLALAKGTSLPVPVVVLLPFLGFMLGTLVMLLIHLKYPAILAKSVASEIDRGLLFACRDMLIQTSSGIPLFNVMSNIAEGDYGPVSVEFKRTVSEARSGTALTTALENMAIRNQSKYLNKMSWQLITAMRSGSNLTTALKGVIKLLVDYQLRLNKAYTAELNFIVLIYLLVAAVMPTVGTTVLVIFSVFGMLGVTPEIYMALVVAGFVLQIMIIGYVYIRRPKMYEE